MIPLDKRSAQTVPSQDSYVLVVDACVLINFLKAGQTAVLTEAKRFRIVITRSVFDEITDPAQQAGLAILADSSALEVTDPESVEAVGIYISLLDSGLGRGEASSLAFAAIRKCVLACDEKTGCFRRAVDRLRLANSVVTTRDLINLAVHENRFDLKTANLMIEALRTHHRFSCDELTANEDLPPALKVM